MERPERRGLVVMAFVGIQTESNFEGSGSGWGLGSLDVQRRETPAVVAEVLGGKSRDSWVAVRGEVTQAGRVVATDRGAKTRVGRGGGIIGGWRRNEGGRMNE